MISVSIEDPSQVIGRKPDAKLLARVRRFVELNRDALLEYWDSETVTTDELQRRLRRIDEEESDREVPLYSQRPPLASD